MSKSQKNKKPPKEIVLPVPAPDEIKPPSNNFNQSLDLNSMLDEISHKQDENIPTVDIAKKEVI